MCNDDRTDWIIKEDESPDSSSPPAVYYSGVLSDMKSDSLSLGGKRCHRHELTDYICDPNEDKRQIDFISYTLLAPAWIFFCLQNCLNSSRHRGAQCEIMTQVCQKKRNEPALRKCRSLFKNVRSKSKTLSEEYSTDVFVLCSLPPLQSRMMFHIRHIKIWILLIVKKTDRHWQDVMKTSFIGELWHHC